MISLDTPANHARKGATSYVVLAVALAAAIFAFDVVLPFGVAGGAPYVILVLLGLWFPWRPAVLVLAAVATVLALLGCALSSTGGSVWMVIVDRALVVFIIWVVALLAFERRKSDEALDQANAELARQVEAGTAELREANESLAREIAEHERTAQDLRTGDARLRHAHRMVRLGHWEWTPQDDRLRFSQEAALILGVVPDDLPTRSSEFKERFVHPDDRAKYTTTTYKTIDDAVGYQLEYRVLRADGEVRYIAELAEITCDNVGRRVGMSGTIQDVTERKRAEEALQEARTELEARVAARTAELVRVNDKLICEVAEREKAQRQLLEKSSLLNGFFHHPGVIASIKDLDGRYLMVNSEFERVSGVSGEDVKGKTLHDLFPEDMANSIRAHSEQVIRSGQPETREVHASHADGTIHTYMATKFAVPNAKGETIALGTIETDITDRKRAEEAARMSERRMADAQRLARIGSWDWDTRTDEVHWSEEAHQIFGVTQEELGGSLEGFYALVHPEDRARVACADRNARDRKKSYSVDYRIVRSDGEAHHIFETGEPECDGTGRVVTVKGVLQDVTERKWLEQQLNQTTKLSTLGEMAVGMAHELNQPLHIIRMGADSSLLLMDEGESNVDFHAEQFQLISSQAQRMAEIIDHMLIFGRAHDEGATRFDLVACVTDAIHMVGERLHVDDIHVSATMPDSCRAVYGRPVRFEQVMLNLLNNARDAILANPRLTAPSRRAKRKVDVKVVDDQRKNVIRISVTDNGGGIPADVFGRIFEPFYTTKEVGKGTGLGLSISYGIITEMGGTIEASNVRNKARFEISLPVCTDA